MTLPAPTYDLVLMLDPRSEPDARAKIVADTRAAIEAQGQLLRHDEWGDRALAFPIEKQATAEYHLMQFHIGTTDLLSGLDRTLRITDGVLRFRTVKLAPGVPEAPNMGSGAAAAPEAAPAVDAPPAPAPEAEVEAPAETPAPAEAPAAPEAEAEVAADAPIAEPA